MYRRKSLGALAMFTCLLIPQLPPCSVSAAEISLVHGLYKQSKVKDGMSKSDITLGGRYSEQFEEHMYWFGQADLSLKTYSGGSPTPSNSTNLSLAGGSRYYLDRLSERISPFASGTVSFKSTTDAIQQFGTIQEVSLSGLYYGADVGMRFSLSSDFFLDLSTPLFESALFANEKTTTKIQDPTSGDVTETSQERSVNELYVNTQSAFSSLIVSVGMRL
ncbi:MAG: hypothetical protein AB8G05_12375 [Oligoflexales bacterium]